MTPASWAFLVDSVPFTKAVRDGETSLGGSESACLGLARALKAKGHQIHVFASRLAEDAQGADPWGVIWHRIEDFQSINQFIEWDVCVGLRNYLFFGGHVHARMRVLWNQDLLVGNAGKQVMAVAWALDKSLYVSEYHRAQWEDVQPELKPLGAVTKNGYDPAHVGQGVKDPNRIIHISRPERGLAPLLAMWPAFKQRKPEATLQICRYQSMYDGEGSNVRAVCESFDEQVQRVNEAVGGIEYLGSLNKAQLYKAISEAAVMWYPGIATFAETSCIAAIESQANGTPFVGSLKGALAETALPSFEHGLLIPGDAMSPEYQEQSIAKVLELMDGCARQSRVYRTIVEAGKSHVKSYTYDALAAEWEAMVDGWFQERYEANKLRVLRRLLHEDDHTAAMMVADGLRGMTSTPEGVEADEASRFCRRVIKGLEQGADDYAAHAIQDPLIEVELAERFKRVSPYYTDSTKILDVACGNGAGAIRFALDNPDVQVVGLDYAAANVLHATEAAARAGVGDRCRFFTATVWNFDTDQPHNDATAFLSAFVQQEGLFDAAFVGEFVEHVANCSGLIDWVEQWLADGARVVYTCPSGPFAELLKRGDYLQRGHVHCFKHDDIKAVWGKKLACKADFFDIGHTPRFSPIGHWIVHYKTAPNRPAGQRDYATRIVRTRPMERLSVGVITRNVETDLGRCLTSVWAIADEIIVGDTGSTDTTKDVAKAYGAKVLDLPEIRDIREGFAGARNLVLKEASGDWFMWIDADEICIEPHLLRRYLGGAVYNGYILHQRHLQLDSPPYHDIPVRVFRKAAPIQFYGCVHEQPQQSDCNGEIYPVLELADVSIAHTGYMTEDVRQDKMLNRNLPLLMLDQQVFPERELGKVLVLRDCVNLADREVASKGYLSEGARYGYARAVSIFLAHFDDPAHRYHKIARPWYEAALRHLGIGMEVELAMAGRYGGLKNTHAKPERIWVRDADEFERYLTFKTKQAADQMRDVPVKTDPFVLPQGVAA